MERSQYLGKGRPDRSPKKHRKWMDRERRLREQLAVERNGHKGAIQRMLHTTRSRLSQLRGHVPSCHRTKHYAADENGARVRGAVYDEKGTMVYYSVGGRRVPHEMDMDAVIEAEQEIHRIAIGNALYDLLITNDAEQRSDAVWESEEVLQGRQGGIDLAHLLCPMPKKDSAAYALHQLGHD